MGKVIRIRQAKQARNSEAYDDQKPNGAAMETDPIQLEQDLNNMRSQLRRIIDSTGNWFDDPDVDLATIFANGRRFRQDVTGDLNGVNVTYAVVEDFRHDGGNTDEQVFLNGLLQEEGFGCDYEAIESAGPSTGFDTIRFDAAPRAGDSIKIDYTPA
jgi:hypothetical protein